MGKKGQVTAFIILGMVLLLAIAGILMLRGTIKPGQTGEELITVPGTSAELRNYVQSCISLIAPEIIEQIAANGGKINLSEEEYIWDNNEKYRTFCYNLPEHERCLNSFITRQEIEEEMNKALKEKIDDCLSLDKIREQGIEVIEGEKEFKARIGKSNMIIALKYPVTLKLKETTISIEDYAADVSSNFGIIYDLAVSIVNSEISNKYFDKDEWMTKNNEFVRIEKHKPYPNIAYKLSRHDANIGENLTFRFSLQGEDKSVKPGAISQSLSVEKDCLNTYDQSCFKTVPESICQEKKGQVTRCTFGFPSTFGDNCNGHGCRGCATKDGEEKAHGSSWCVYDSVQKLASYGLAYVGSRHYMQSCIDGEIINEECVDFREELCTEQDINGRRKAMCRPNRWEDCAFCESEQCCENELYRDCQWDARLFDVPDSSRVEMQYASRKCFPKVPPGFRFWDGYGNDVCNMGTQYAYCKGWGACPARFVDDSALYCMRLGDCGNSRNINDKLTKTGFFNTDPNDRVSDFVYLSDGLNKDPVSELGMERQIEIPLYSVEQRPLVREYPTTVEKIPILMQEAVSYLRYVKSLSPNPLFLINLDPKVLEYSFCSLWSQPEGSDDCDLCSAEPEKPCSEYRCKSLGRNCKFEMNNGVGICEAYNSDDKTGPNIDFNSLSLQEGYTAEKKQIIAGGETLEGYEISPAVKPYFLFSFGIKTDEETKCKLTYLPIFSYYELPSIWLGESRFSKNHDLSLRFPKEMAIPSKVYNFLDINSLTEIVTMVENLDDTYNRYKSKYSLELSIIKAIKNIDVDAIGDRIVKIAMDTIRPLLDLFPFLKDLANVILAKLQDNSYILFVKCIDEAGNENQKPFFITFKLDVNAQDDYPPMFVDSKPKNNSEIYSTAETVNISYYVNEPADCRADISDRDYELMIFELDCEKRSLAMSSIGYGSYECKGELPFTGDEMKYYFRCKDNPEIIEDYHLTFVNSENMSYNTNSTPYFNVTPEGVVYADARMLEDGDFMYANADTLSFNMYLEYNAECRYVYDDSSFAEASYSFGACIESGNPILGEYMCSAPLLLPEFTDDKNATLKIMCRDINPARRNTNDKSTVLHFNRSKSLQDLLSITSSNIWIGNAYYASGGDIPSSSPTIKVVMSKKISEASIICGYYENREDGVISMIKVGEYNFEASLENIAMGRHSYKIECKDSADNRIITEVNFTVVAS